MNANCTTHAETRKASSRHKHIPYFLPLCLFNTATTMGGFATSSQSMAATVASTQVRQSGTAAMLRNSGGSPALRHALHLNNRAARLISKEEEYAQAISILSASLVQVKQAIRSGGETDQEAAVPALAGQHVMLCFEAASHKMEVEGDEVSYLCRDPLLINEDIAGINKMEAIELVSFACIYNLGLCYHSQGMAMNGDPIRLRRSISFYEHAQRMLENHPTLMIQSLVLSNNMGHAHCLLGNETIAKSFFQRLLSAMIYLSHNVSENTMCWDGFMMNIMQHLLGESHHAPAA